MYGYICSVRFMEGFLWRNGGVYVNTGQHPVIWYEVSFLKAFESWKAGMGMDGIQLQKLGDPKFSQNDLWLWLFVSRCKVGFPLSLHNTLTQTQI